VTRDHDALHDLIAPVALGAAHPREIAQVEAHAEQCPVCAEDLAAYRQSADVLARAVPQVEPSPALRRQLMDAVRADLKVRETMAAPAVARRRRQRRSWFASARPWPVATAAVLAGALVLAGWNVALQTRDEAPSGEVTALSVSGDAGVKGRVLYVPDEDTAVVRLTRLRPAGAGRGYELWILREGAAPRSAGFLDDAGPAERVKVVSGLRGASGLAVTAEPLSNLTRPTSDPIIEIPLARRA
jgi:anti-sigma-K factor RskA